MPPFSGEVKSLRDVAAMPGPELQAYSAAPSVAAGSVAAVQAPIDRLIIRRQELTLVMGDVSQAVERITDLAASYGGFVVSSSSSFNSAKPSASITIRVPSESWRDAVRQMKGMALEVREEKGSAQDVTEEFTDLEAQTRNLEATEARYLELLGRAQTIDEILKVQQRLNEVRGQIERLQGRMLYLQRSADMALITATLLPPPERPSIVQVGWSPAVIFADALRFLLLGLQRVATAMIWASVLGSPIFALGLLLWGWRALRRPSAPQPS